MFTFKIKAKQPKSKARVGEFTTPHGKLLTPEYVFVATDDTCNTNQYKLTLIGCTSKTYTYVGLVGTAIAAAYLLSKKR